MSVYTDNAEVVEVEGTDGLAIKETLWTQYKINASIEQNARRVIVTYVSDDVVVLVQMDPLGKVLRTSVVK